MPWIIDENGSWVQVEDEQFKRIVCYSRSFWTAERKSLPRR